MNTKTINKLETSEEIKNFETIDKNIETFDFSDLKAEILGK